MTFIQFTYGHEVNVPNSEKGVPIWTVDTNNFYIGTDILHKPKRITVHQDSKESEDTIFAGQPIYINNAGHAKLAQAVLGSQNVAGLALNDVTSSFACNYQTSGIITLDDWTHVIGSASLSPNTYYFLDYANAGKLITIIDDSIAEYSVKVGFALDGKNLDISNRFIVKL